MSRIQTKFSQLAQANQKALIAYITAGDPSPEITVPLLHELAKSGVDIIELGIPFSDPMAEGPIIQAAHERALSQGVTLRHVLQMVAEFRRKDNLTPIVLMGYLNPIEKMGYQSFAEEAQYVGVDGLLVVDLPCEEAGELTLELRVNEIDPIFLLAPTTTFERSKIICQQAGGYHYYVALKGVTGAGGLDIASVRSKLAELRPSLRLPIVIGFGIRDAKTAVAVAALADGVVVGSELVARIAALANNPAAIYCEVGSFITELRNHLDSKS